MMMAMIYNFSEDDFFDHNLIFQTGIKLEQLSERNTYLWKKFPDETVVGLQVAVVILEPLV